MNFLGIDIGFGEVKAILADKSGALVKSSCFPTLIAEHIPAPLEDDKITFQLRGIEYVLGKEAEEESGCFQLHDFKDMMEFAPLLFRRVIRNEFKLDKADFVTCASIPPGWWDHRKDFADILSKETQYVVVAPQGHGALITTKEEKGLGDAETVLVLDFGYNTVNYLLAMKEGQDFKITRGDTVSGLGVVRLVKLFRGELEGELSELPSYVLKKMLRHGYGKLYGEKINLEGYKKRAIEKYYTILMRELKNSVGEIWRKTDAVICAGGGVHYFDPKKSLPHHRIVIPSLPEFANAKGQAMSIANGYLQSMTKAGTEK